MGAAVAAAGGAEASAPLLSKYLYGKEAKDLTADEKGTISAITGLVASGVGASTAEVASTVQSGQVAQNAVDNNYLTVSQIQQFDKEMDLCKTNVNCEQKILEKYKKIALDQDKQLAAVCSVNAILCKEEYGFIVEYRNEIKKALADTQNLPAVYESGLLAQQVDAEGFVLNVELARQFKTKYNISDEDAAKLAMAVSAIGVGKGVKGKKVSDYEPNKDSVGNMGKFLSTNEFGRLLAKNSSKTSKKYDGQSVYQASGKVGDYIKKGDQIYLDGSHKDHLEIFDKNGNFKVVVNLDGKINQKKTEAAKGRKLK